MKHDSVELLKWYQEQTDTIEVPWARIEQELCDQWQWLQQQPRHTCQVMVENTLEQYRLIAEFYQDQKLAEYRCCFR